jgi:fatty-acid desaturase
MLYCLDTCLDRRHVTTNSENQYQKCFFENHIEFLLLHKRENFKSVTLKKKGTNCVTIRVQRGAVLCGIIFIGFRITAFYTLFIVQFYKFLFIFLYLVISTSGNLTE